MKSILIALFLVLFSSSAFAEPAILINGDACGLLDGNGDGLLTNDTKTTFTFSQNGNVTMKCIHKDAPNSTGSAVHWDFDSTSFFCSVRLNEDAPWIQTEDWKETVSASGKAVLTCKFRTED